MDTVDEVVVTEATPEPTAVEAPPEVVLGEELPPPDRFLNRELSWLEFNARVLTLAEDQGMPMLERAKFLAIFASNLDEFYMVRVAGLKRRMSTGLPMRSGEGTRGGEGASIREQLTAITERTAELIARHSWAFASGVAPELAAAGVEILRWSD